MELSKQHNAAFSQARTVTSLPQAQVAGPCRGSALARSPALLQLELGLAGAGPADGGPHVGLQGEAEVEAGLQEQTAEGYAALLQPVAGSEQMLRELKV